MHTHTPQLFQAKRRSGFTLAEVLISLVLIGMAVGGLLYGYLMAARRAEFSAYSLAAQALAIQRLEQTRATSWQPNNVSPVDQLQATNFPNRVEVLDVPLQGTNIVYATNKTTISTISSSPPLRMVRVDCTWYFLNKGVVTNTIVTYRSPDQ